VDATDVQSQHELDGTVSTAREQARQRLRARRDFANHLVAYIVVNGFFIAIWAMTGAGYFWPAWLLGTWAIGLVLHAWDLFGRRAISEADVDAELRRHP
jgi:hypothetical protein